MRLEHLCEMKLAYREESLYESEFVVVRPYDSQEASEYGEGDGWVKGPRLKGAARWASHSYRRTDGVWLPNVYGVIQTGEGASILFSLNGRTKFVAGGQGHQLLAVIFETGDERYKWLNDKTCVLEGIVEGFAMRAQVFRCINDLTAREA